ncbi:MAG: hypothetical protein BWY42_01512 [Candidatus Omnitrophica bacterium ADurb.Bin277]|nr:MAG: hypothetical protein BWY42_01512 [Candidatus Omnitrophica bacterium ADurb.Bin277]
MFDWKGGDVRRFKDPENARFFNETIEKIFVMRGSSYVLIRTRNGRYLGCDLRDGDLKITDLTGFFRKEVPSDIQWEGGHPEYLFPFYDGAIDRIDLGKQKVTSEFIGDVRGFGVSRGRLYALQDQSLTRLSFSSNQRSPEVIDEGRFLKELFHEKDRYRMDFFRNDTVLFSGARGSLLANFLPYRFVEKGMAGYVPDTSLRKMLVWTRKELGFLDLEKKAPAKALFERGPEIDWFYDQGQDIRQSCFVHGDSHVLFSDEDRICLMPTGDPSALPFEIAGILKDSGVFYSERTGKVYFLDRETGYFSSVEILPEETILAKMFPEIEKTEEEGPEA